MLLTEELTTCERDKAIKRIYLFDVHISGNITFLLQEYKEYTRTEKTRWRLIKHWNRNYYNLDEIKVPEVIAKEIVKKFKDRIRYEVEGIDVK